MVTTAGSWQIWVDTGGTFTDGVAVAPDGTLVRVKALSTGALRGTAIASVSTHVEVRVSWSLPSPAPLAGLAFRLLDDETRRWQVRRYDPQARSIELDQPLGEVRLPATFELASSEGAPIFVARLLTGTAIDDELPPCRLRVATTLGTNALLQRKGARTALFITRGFGDLLAIGTQQRPDLFRLDIHKPEALHEVTVEVPERLSADGSVLEPLDALALEERARELVARGVRVAAVALMHAYRDPRHEQELKRRLLAWGFDHVSCSSELAPRIKLLERAETSVADAYLAPALRSFVASVEERLPAAASLLLMTSAGSLLGPRVFRPKDGLLSGPAGGAVGSALACRRSGFARAIGFDMGGTSTDVTRYDGGHDYRYEQRVGTTSIAAPALAIETVAAGGGSICWLDGERLRVGPESAGASPGPACYGSGGPLALTDVNLLLGRIDPEGFEIPLRIEDARARFSVLRLELERRTGTVHTPEELLEGFLAIANEIMADAMRRVSLRRGYDPGEYVLVAFGGAGGQHACAIADLLGQRRILVPADAGLLSAIGLGHAAIERFEERQILLPLERAQEDLPEWFAPLCQASLARVEQAGAASGTARIRRRILNLRFAGQDATLEVDWEGGSSAGAAFGAMHERLFGHKPERRDVELESIRVVASSPAIEIDPVGAPVTPFAAVPCGERHAWFGGASSSVPLYDRAALQPGAAFTGPALVLEAHSTTVVEPGWAARVDACLALVLERSPTGRPKRGTARPEAVRLELFTQRFTSVVEEMGVRLERTAVSTNVKERLDFSCALLDAEGRLVASAPHIPVHLGAIGLCVRQVAATLPLEPGDVAVTNHPAFGGSHLPDVTVITPVFAEDKRIGYVANRAHHAEIGGVRPGSMPPHATCLAEEGVVIPPSYVLRRNTPLWPEIRRRLETAEHPTRNVEDNLADLRAAVAANHAGAEALCGLARSFGAERVLHYMHELRALAASRVREALLCHGDGRFEATERLDDGTPLQVAIEIAGGCARFDFSGSGGVHPGNLNATPAIVHSTLIYLLRLLLRDGLPLNDGLLQGVTIEIPPGILSPVFGDDPRHAPAVGGGNVETSQRLVDTLLRALELAACSQGTMNNLIFGNERFGYYETIGGGAGAGPTFDGASGVHTHMTNTRITDPEILEQRYPVRVERFALRRGSGGAGRFRGGDGIVREIRFLEAVSLSIVSQHRALAPYGLYGGADGFPGRQQIVRASGTVVDLAAIDGCEVAADDRLVIETPGGGGWGAA